MVAGRFARPPLLLLPLLLAVAIVTVGVPRPVGAKDTTYELILGFNMHNNTLDYSRDLLGGLFLGFWDKLESPVPLAQGNSLKVRLDVRSNQENENARYWATDSTERFFGIIAQQDYNTTQTIFGELNSIHKNDFPFIAPVIGNAINFTQGSQTLWKHTAVLVRESYTLDLVHLIEFAYNKLDVQEFGILYQAQESFSTKSVVEDALSKLECHLIDDRAVDEANVEAEFLNMRSTGVKAFIVAHRGSVIKKLLTSASFRKNRPPFVLVCTLDLDEVLEVKDDPRNDDYQNVYIATGLPRLTDNHPLVNNFNKVFGEYKRKEQPTYALLEGFLYARFFMGVCAKALNRSNTLTSESFLHAVFSGEQFDIDGVQIGPYCDEATQEKCGKYECNVGFRSTNIWKFDKDHKIALVSSKVHSEACSDPIKLNIEYDLAAVVVCFVMSLVCSCAPPFLLLRKYLLEERMFETDPVAHPAPANLADDEEADVRGQQRYHEAVLAEVRETRNKAVSISEEDLLEVCEVGHGSSAQVTRAVWYGATVAVKRMGFVVESLSPRDAICAFKNEIQQLQAHKHPCIVQLYGITPKLAMVLEYMEHGSLKEFAERRQLKDRMRAPLARQIASAVAYLHSKDTLHCGLCPSSVFVTGSGAQVHAKLAGFGGARPAAATKRRARPQLPPLAEHAYTDPDVLRGAPFTPASDVYSLGAVLWFLEREHDPPVVDTQQQQQQQQQQEEEEDEEERRPQLGECVLFRKEIRACWAEPREARPTASAVAGMLCNTGSRREEDEEQEEDAEE